MTFSIRTLAAPSALSLLLSVAAVGVTCFALSETTADNTSAKENHVYEYEYEYSALAIIRRGLSLIDEEEELPPLFPFQVQAYVGFSVTILGLLLAAGGGIGGGGILVPTYILILQFPVKHAIPLASTTVFGGAIANNLLNARKMHPSHPFRPLVDWDLMLQLEPMAMWGTLIGAVLINYLPGLVLVIMMVLLLSFTAHATLAQAHKMHKKESEALLKAQEQQQLREEGMPLVVDGKDIESKPSYNATNSSDEPDNAAAAAAADKTTEEPKKRIWAQVFFDAVKLTALFVVIISIKLWRGGPEEVGGLAGVWKTQLLLAVVIFMFAVVTRQSLLERKQSEGGVVLSDIEWDEANTITYPLMAVVAGLSAGLFGVGGGIIVGPLMLALGVHPAVASATTACMVLYTSFMAMVSFMVLGLLAQDYAGFCLAIGFASTIVGQTVMAILMERYKRNSYIAYSIGIVVGLSAIAMSIESVIAILG